jgi:hypothetical protein
MKAESGTWIYILLSIVFLVLSAIGNKNKKKAETTSHPDDDDYDTQPTPSERNWPRSLEDVLNEVLDVPKKPEVVVEKPSWSRQVEVEKPHSYEYHTEKPQSLETIDEEIFSYETALEPLNMDRPVYQSISPIREAQVGEDTDREVKIQDFDLRQGIIYAEILNRKYF